MDAAAALADLTRDLVPDRGGGRLRRERRAARLDARRRRRRAGARRGEPASCSRPPRPCAARARARSPGRGGAARGERLRRPRRRADDRRARPAPEPTVGPRLLRPEAHVPARRAGRARGEAEEAPSRPKKADDAARKARRVLARWSPARWPAAALSALVAAAAAASACRLYYDDGSLVYLGRGGLAPKPSALLALARAARPASRAMNDAELGAPDREHALPRGRLRAPLRQALALVPRQVPLRDRARAAARRSASGSRRPSREPSRRPRGSPGRRSERSRWPLRRRWRPGCPSSSSAVKPRNTAPRTASRAPFEPGELVCLVEDVVTSGGALVRGGRGRSRGRARRPARGLRRRPRGGRRRRARAPRRAARPLFRASELLADAKKRRKTAWLSRIRSEC